MDANELLERLTAEAERTVDHNDTTPICDVARLHLDALKRIHSVESHKDRVEELEEEIRELERAASGLYSEEYLYEYAAEEYDRGLTEGAQSRDDEIEVLEDRIESLEEDIENLETEVSELEKELEKTKEELGDEIKWLKKSRDDLEDQLAEDDIKKLARLKDPDVHTRSCCPIPE